MVSELRDLRILEDRSLALADKTLPLLDTVSNVFSLEVKLRELASDVAQTQSVGQLSEIFNHTRETLSEIARLQQEDPQFPKRDIALFQDLRNTQFAILYARESLMQKTETAQHNLHRFIDQLSSAPFSLTPEGRLLLDRGQRFDFALTWLGSEDARRDALERAEIQRDLETLSLQISQLREVEVAAELAPVLATIEELLKGPDGALKRLSILRDLESERAALLEQAHNFMGELSDWADRATSAAALDFRLAAQTTLTATHRIRMVNFALNFAILSVSLLLLWWTVEKQIISRLIPITRHAHTLARGEHTEPIKITGADEISEVEHALEHARYISNALHQRNEELQHFAFVAAHDLRTPLDGIANLIHWTLEDEADALSQEARRNLRLADHQVTRLSNHLAGLLQYARAGENVVRLDQFDLVQFVSGLKAEMAGDTAFDIFVEGVPQPVKTHASALSVILRKLVGNALKHHDRSHGTIALSMYLRDDVLEIHVRDDGPGIHKEYHKKVFVLFQTLKTRDEVEGSGLGLAVARKLAQSLGGDIWIESDPDFARGTLFAVRLPYHSSSILPQTLIEERRL